jgi:hypothetical protein
VKREREQRIKKAAKLLRVPVKQVRHWLAQRAWRKCIDRYYGPGGETR